MHSIERGNEPWVEPSVMRRLAVALVVSIGVHGASLYFVHARPPHAIASTPSSISAWIEDPNSRRDAQPSSTPVSADEGDPVPVEATPSPPPAEQPSPSASTESPLSLARAAEAIKPDARAGIEIPALRDAMYYTVAALDKLPNLVGDADGCYPMGAVGEVIYTLLIDETGAVAEATISDVKPVGLFTTAAEEACRALKFVPAEKNGRSVRSRVRFVVGANRP